LFAFAGPAYVVAVGYMDPGNWATDLAGGSQFGYKLIWVLLMSNLMAILLQTLSARLGLVTGRDLAQACRDAYPRWICYVLFVLCEIAIAACDLAEVIGSAIGLNLLFGIPVIWGVAITAFDVLLLMAIQRLGIRKMEAFILAMVVLIGLCFCIEVFLVKPDAGQIAMGFLPGRLSSAELFVAVGILGATVMPHNLYLHSALVQSRDVRRSREAVREACRFNLIDSVIGLNLAFLVNAAILVVAAAAFWETKVGPVEQLQDAHALLERMLGTWLAPYVFALALLCAGQSSTITGTLAGQITMEGFLQWRIRPWLRRMITRLAAIVPAVCVVIKIGDHGLYELLIVSQIILSLQLSFAVVPLVKFTGSKRKMGPFANAPWVQATAWVMTGIIVALNVSMAYNQIVEWAGVAGSWAWLVIGTTAPLGLALLALLAWLLAQREKAIPTAPTVSAEHIAAAAAKRRKRFCRIGVALEALPSDAAMLAEAIALAKIYRAELFLMHVVEGVGGQWYGEQTGDAESREDAAYLDGLASQLRSDLAEHGIPAVHATLGYGDVPRQIIALSRRHKLDLLVLGGHGHRGLQDVVFGNTIPGVRHGLDIPILTVRG
jgi:manganese transport protein